MVVTSAAIAADPKLSHGEALQKSMLAMIDNARHPERADPRFWAPFVVVGEPASALTGERNGRLIIKNALDEPPFSWLLILLRAHLGELAHACGLIAFDGHLKLLRPDQGSRA
jgi:hypothetical protein